MRGLFGNSSSSSRVGGGSSNKTSYQSGSDPQSPTRRSFAFMKHSPGKRSNASMRRIREHAGQIAQQIASPDLQETSPDFSRYQDKYRPQPQPQDRLNNTMNGFSTYDQRPPVQNRRKVALNMFMEQQERSTSGGPGSVVSDFSRSSSVKGVAARRLARSKQQTSDRSISGNSMSTFPSNSSMQRSFVQNKSNSNRPVGSTGFPSRNNTAKETVSSGGGFFADFDNEMTRSDFNAETPRLSTGGSTGSSRSGHRSNFFGESSHSSRHGMSSSEESPDLEIKGSQGFSFDAFGLDAEEVDSEVNAALQDLAGSHPHLSKMLGGGTFPPSPAGSYSASTPTREADDEGSVDGFKVMSLPLNISKHSPASSERSTLTSSSPTDGNDQGGRTNMFKEQAGFHSSQKPLNSFATQQASDSWASFEPSPSSAAPKYARSEPGGNIFDHAWSEPASARSAPTMPNLFDEAEIKSDKGSDVEFDQSSWEGDSDGELSPEVAKQYSFDSANRKKDDPFSFQADFGAVSDAGAMEYSSDGGAPSSAACVHEDSEAGAASSAGGFALMSNTGASSAANFAFAPETGPPSSAGGFAFASDAEAASSAGGFALTSDAGVSSKGAPSDVGVMHFESDVGVASDTAFGDDFVTATIPQEIVGSKQKNKAKLSSETTNNVLQGSHAAAGPIVSSLAAKWEIHESEARRKPIPKAPAVHSSTKAEKDLATTLASKPRLSETEMRRNRLNDMRNGEIIGPQILQKTMKAEISEQQKRANECVEQRSSFGSYKERLRPAHLRNDNNGWSSKSEVGGSSFPGHAEVNSIYSKMQRNQHHISQRETKSEAGASSDFLAGVKLRRTGGIERLMSKDSSDEDSQRDLDANDHDEYHRTIAEDTEPNRTSQNEEKPKMTYRERRELELQRQKAEKEAEEKQKETSDRDVASLIRKRIAATKKKPRETDSKAAKPGDNITATRNRLKKVAVEKDTISQGKPYLIALEEQTLTTENSYSTSSLERERGPVENPAHYQVNNPSAPYSTEQRNEPELSARSSHESVPTHVHASPSEERESPLDFANFPNEDEELPPTLETDERPPLHSSSSRSESTRIQSDQEKETIMVDAAATESNEEKASKKAMLNAFFGSRLSLTPQSSQDDLEEKKSDEDVNVIAPRINPQNHDFFSETSNEPHEEDPQTSIPQRKAAKETHGQLHMDVDTARSVLSRKSQRGKPSTEVQPDAGEANEDSEPEEIRPFDVENASSFPPGRVALKDDPQFEKYFRMLKVGMPMDVVKHAMTRDGIDASVMDGDHSKPAGGVPMNEDPKFHKYFKMLKMGLPMGAVKNAMQRDGLDPVLMDGDHNAPAGSGLQSSDEPSDKKEKDTHRRTRLHWETLRKVRANSLWAQVNEDPELQQLHIDEEEFASLFQAELTPSSFQVKKGPTPSNQNRRKGPSVRVIDPKRANNGGIVLARLKISQDDLADIVDKIDDSSITAEQMQHIVEYLPTADERRDLEKYMLEGGLDAAEKFDMLCECEKFMVAMMTVKHAKRKVRALLFKLQFQSCLESLEQDASMVETSCDELSNSVRLRKLLGIVLNIGNRLNTAGNGSKRKAGAFTIASLLKLSHAKAFDRKTTFLQYVVLIVQRNNELLLRFKDDLPTVMKATKVYWDQCLNDLEEVENQLENARLIALHLARIKNIYRLKKKRQSKDGVDDDDLSVEELDVEEEVAQFRETEFGHFTLYAIKKTAALREKVELTIKKFGKLLEYFGEEEKRSDMQPHDLFTIIYDFCKDFEKAKEQVIENEKKKLREERKRNASSKKQVSTRSADTGKTNLKASSLQPNMSALMKGMKPVQSSSKSDPGGRLAHPDKPRSSPTKERKSLASIPVDPYGSRAPKAKADVPFAAPQNQGRPPLDQTLSPRSSMRQKRRMQQRNSLNRR